MTVHSARASGEAAQSGVSSWYSRRATTSLGYALLAALAYLPPLLTDRGRVAADTKQYLYLDPGRLLERASSMWDPNIGMGTVTHQNIGYLFPMGPFYWTLDRIGLPDWAAQRLWLGSLVFAAATGVLYLCRALGRRGPGVAVAALAYAFSPYSLHYAARISVILLPWAALGWLLGFTIRALRDGGWRYPALFAITVQVVGGVNATALVFAGVAPALWVLHSVLLARDVPLRRAAASIGRIALLAGVTSLWWMAGLSIQGGYGINILKYTETVKAVARTSMPNEVLRGLGYWFFYGQDRIGPWIESAHNYTQRPLVILLGYGLACLALLAAGTVRWRHRTYFALVALVGVVIAVGAHPYDSPTPLGALFKAFAGNSKAGLALRSTGRAIPLVVLGLAMLLGAGVDAVGRWLAIRGRARLSLGVALLAGALVLANFPALHDGTYYGTNLQRPEEVPGYWTEAAAYLDAQGHETRVIELPGSDFAAYLWGNTVDPITPGLMDRPYVARELIPYGNEPTADLLNAFDRRLQEGVSDPAGYRDLLARMSVGDVVLRNDIQYQRYDLVRPRALVRLMATEPEGLSLERTFGETAAGPPAPTNQDEETLAWPPGEEEPPPVMVYAVDGASPIVRTEADSRALVVAGSGEGLVDASDIGLLTGAGVVLYSASYPDEQDLRDAVAGDAVLVVTDSNRRRGRRWSTVLDNTGYTEQAGEQPYVDDPSDARLDMFPGQAEDAYTVTEQRGVREVVASAYGNPISYTPEDRPANAFDGDVETSWKAAAFDEAIGHRIRVELDEQITTDRVNLVQNLSGPRERWITEVELSFDGGEPQRVSLLATSRTERGQTVLFEEETFSTLEIKVRDVNVGRRYLHRGASPVGFAEIRMADRDATGDVRIDEVIRMPEDLLGALGDASAEHPLVLVMSRQRQVPVPPRSDEELGMARAFTLPTGRTFGVTGTIRLSPDVPSALLDSLLGLPTAQDGGVDTDANEYLEGCIRCRAGAAIDGDRATAWNTPFVGVERQWVDYELSQPVTFDHMDLQVVADGRHSVPTHLLIEADGAAREVALPEITDLAVENATQEVTLRFPELTGRHIRVTVVAVRKNFTSDYFSTQPKTEPVGIAELGIPGLRLPEAPARVPPTCRTDLMMIDGDPFPVRMVGDRDTAEALGAIELLPCDPADPERVPVLDLGAGEHLVRVADGIDTGVQVYRLVVACGADGESIEVGGGRVTGLPREAPPAPAATVEESGRTSMRVRVQGATEPFWLVLGESNNAGWTARVAGGESLGGSRLVDGYANGWRIDPDGRDSFVVEIDWTPQRRVSASIAVSALGMLVCAGIVAVTWRRRRARAGVTLAGAGTEADEGADEGTDAPVLSNPFSGSGERAPAWAIVLGPLLTGGAAAAIVTPWVGLAVGVLVLGALRWPAARGVIAMLPPLVLGSAALYIAYKQQRDHLPPVFEWPTLFPRARTAGWVAIVLIGADAAVELLWRGRRSSPVAPE